MNTLVKIKEYDAHGGPSNEKMGGDGHAQTSTTTGRFVIKSIEKHVSYGRYAIWSGIAWGTEVKISGNIVMIKQLGSWKKLTDVNAQWGAYKNDQKKVTDAVLNYQRNLYPNSPIPTKWLFNDFGHVSVKYFKDLNNDRKMNGKEQVMGDFIHTTPPDEAATASGRIFQLAESHGCIHVRPGDIDTMIGNGYLKKGNTIEVHPYTKKAIDASHKRNAAGMPFEVHFYPGLYKIAIYKTM